MRSFNFLYETADFDFISDIIEEASYNFTIDCIETDNLVLVEALVDIIKQRLNDTDIEAAVFENFLPYVEDCSNDFCNSIMEAEIYGATNDPEMRDISKDHHRWGSDMGKQTGEAIGYKRAKKAADRISYYDVANKYNAQDNIDKTNRQLGRAVEKKTINLNPALLNSPKTKTEYSKLNQSTNADVQANRKKGFGLGYGDGYRQQLKKSIDSSYSSNLAKMTKDKTRQLTAQVLQDRTKRLNNERSQDNAAIRNELKSARLAQQERRANAPKAATPAPTPPQRPGAVPSTPVSQPGKIKQFGSSILTGVRNGLTAAKTGMANRFAFGRR